MKSKDDQVRRYLEGMKHERSFEERKEIKRQSRERKATRPSKGRRARDWNKDDEAPTTESMARKGSASSNSSSPTHTTPPSGGGGTTATVLGIFPGRARLSLDGVAIEAPLAEHIALQQRSLLAVGDEVLLTTLADGSPRVVAVLPRRSVLSRPDPARPDLERVIAANVDHAVVTISAHDPAFRPRLVDRYLVALGRGHVHPVVCVTKIDLVDAAERATIAGALAVYAALSIPTCLSSVQTGEGIDTLRTILAGSTAVLVGQSGVGKSSLLNALEPTLALETGDVRPGDGKGRHTTTGSTLLQLADGTRLIDTPGVRAFGLHDLDVERLARDFPDLRALPGACRFSDCTHRTEPDCRVLAAVEDGTLARHRYDAYRRLVDSLALGGG